VTGLHKTIAMKKKLHVTNRHSTKWNEIEAIFIKEQLNLFPKLIN